MSKIRIYELARELGVDNKTVLSMAVDLGIEGKTSHSNSLAPEEADKIRRAVIRTALGSAEAEVTEVKGVGSEGVRVTVRRKGGIIRRRRETKPAEPPSEKQETAVAEAAPEAEPTLDSIFKDKEELVKSEDHTAYLSEKAVETEAEDSIHVAEDATAGVEPAEEDAAEVNTEEDGEDEDAEDRKAGPKVLGKIDLPVRKKAAVPTKGRKKGIVESGVIEDSDEPPSDGKRRRKRQKRSRRKEFNRVDLVDYDGRMIKRPSRRKGGRGQKVVEEATEPGKTEITQPKASKRVIKIDEVITVGELAKALSLKAGEIIAKLIDLGIMATINQTVDIDTATIVAEEFGFTVESVAFDEDLILEDEQGESASEQIARAPVVTVMGHVDHGKTSLLDSIRDSSVAIKEHGGITQHIGAYAVELDSGQSITFVDTPGHEAFTAMRARGAEITDIVVLVVAADDGVMPQTIEAINHAKAAGVAIVVAVNKIDKPGANPDKVRQELAEHGLQPEEWGGDTMFYNVSALKKEGIKELLEGILLQAEVLELKASPDRRASGTIIESRQDRGRGIVATVLVQKGTLRPGDPFVAGCEFGRVRTMRDHLGNRVESALPSVPVEITGLNGIPSAGDDFHAVESDAKARRVAAVRAEKRRKRDQIASGGGPISLEEFARRAKAEEASELNVVIKADVQGSVEAVRQSLDKLSTEKVKVVIVHASVGGITESDVKLAAASKAVIVAFGVRAEPRVVKEAEALSVQLRFYNVIYELVDDVKKAMEGLLAPILKEKTLGTAEVRDTFVVPKVGTIAGSYVTDGLIKRGSRVRLLRDSRVVFEGKMASLRRFKDDVREVQSGYECGIGIEGYNDIKVGDVVEVYEIEEHRATLD